MHDGSEPHGKSGIADFNLARAVMLLSFLLGREARLHEEPGLFSRLNGAVFSFLFLLGGILLH